MVFAKVTKFQRISNYVKIYTFNIASSTIYVGGSFEELSTSLRYTHIQIMESERLGRRQRGKFAFKFGKRLRCFCLVRKIISEHCTIILKTTFEEIIV